MLTHLFLTNFHFTVNVLATLIFFSTGWLHFTSWQLEKKGKSLIIRSTGFFLLAIVAIGQATSIELSQLVLALQITKITGLLMILTSLIKEPILQPPNNKVAAISLILISDSLVPLSAALYLIIAIVYLRKSTEGFEKQNKPMFWGFLFLSLSELVNISFFAKHSQVVFWSNLLSKFGPAWIMAHLLELTGILIIGVWTWGYIRFRARAQLFIIFITASLFIFTATTFSFTFLLLKNLESDALAHLKTDVKVLQYALSRLESESLADAKVVSENSQVADYIKNNNMDKLHETVLEFMISQNTSFLEVTDDTGKVIMRASDKENVGDSLDDLTVKRALDGNTQSTVVIKEGIIAPDILIRSSAPIISDGSVMGVVVTGFKIDSAFVDGVKEVTGLDASVYADDTRVATTFITPDGKSRFISTKQTNEKVLSEVLTNGNVYVGPSEIMNQSFYTAYSPLRSGSDKIIGMLFVGKPQTELFRTAEESIQLTFLGSTVLMMLSIIPSFFVAKYIEKNIKA